MSWIRQVNTHNCVEVDANIDVASSTKQERCSSCTACKLDHIDKLVVVGIVARVHETCHVTVESVSFIGKWHDCRIRAK
jgi:hypothetical protein